MPHRALKLPFAELLAKEGILASEQIGRVLIAQQEQYPALPVGQVCIELGLLSSQQLTDVLSQHSRRLFIGELLAHTGAISQSQLKAALTMQQRHKPRKKLGTILIENGWLDEEILTRALQQQSLPGLHPLPKKRDKFDTLVETQRLTQEQLDEAGVTATNSNLPLETVLIEKYHLTTQEMGDALSAFYQCPFLEYDENRAFDPALVGTLKLTDLRANTWLPLQQTADTVEALIDDPYAFEKLQDIKRVFPGKQLKTVVGLKEEILKYVDDLSSQLTQGQVKTQEAEKQAEAEHTGAGHEALLAAFDSSEPLETAPENGQHHRSVFTQLSWNNSDNESEAVIRLVNQIISEASRESASAIHIEPGGEEGGTQLRLRIDGACYEYSVLPAAARKPLVSQLKVMAGLESAKRWPQEGKIQMSLPHGEIEIRVTTVPTAGMDTEDVVLHLLTSAEKRFEKRSLDQLHLTERNQRAFAGLLTRPSGLILCVGPTGTGKTTTLHAALETLNTPQRKIWTAEDPVEISQLGLRQLQVQPHIGLTFATALRSLLQADPDVIMVGEIRDWEAAEGCIDAAQTGHLVLSTLPTKTTTETVSWILEMGLDSFSFADTLLGVMAQRLAHALCQDCKERYHPPQEEYDALACGYGEAAFAELGIADDNDFVLYRGSGCEQCQHTGYTGRIGLQELLVVTDEIKSQIRDREPASALVHTAASQGMKTLVQDGILKVLRGWTDYTQVKAVVSR